MCIRDRHLEKGMSPSICNLASVSAPPPEIKKTYSIMFYKNGNSIGIREKFDAKRQVVSFGSRDKTEDQLRKIGEKVLECLHSGQSVEQGKALALSLIAKGKRKASN